MFWPDGCESWFIHDELPQRCLFIRSKQQEVPFNSTSNIDDNFSQENLSNSINVSSLIVQQMSSPITNLYSEFCHSDAIIFSLRPTQIFSNEQFNSNIVPLVSSDIILLSFLFISIVFGNLASCLTFYNDITTRYLTNNMIFHHMNHFEWFRALAVP
ncbi:unnamed protein product [Rotaria sp. Silwood2]|nr:unnamed protein product [Rotaria sp. Silwood2]